MFREVLPLVKETEVEAVREIPKAVREARGAKAEADLVEVIHMVENIALAADNLMVK